MTSVAQPAAKRGIVEALIQESDSTVSVVLSPSLARDIMPEAKGYAETETEVEEEDAKVDDRQDDERPGRKVATRTNGYRIQVFSDGRNQSTLRTRARARAKKIISKFPQYNRKVYSFSKAPYYYTRVGNFATRAEADRALAQLRRAFPEFAGEMRVVSSEVIISK